MPPERFKSGVSHLVPLSSTALEVLRNVPRFTDDFVFSTTLGRIPVNGWSKAKAEIDALMVEEIGDLLNWKIHDLRRTVRTRLAALRVPDNVAEMVLGHGKRGLQRVYDQHGYETEMREALEKWAALLMRFVEPDAKVVQLRA